MLRDLCRWVELIVLVMLVLFAMAFVRWFVICLMLLRVLRWLGMVFCVRVAWVMFGFRCLLVDLVLCLGVVWLLVFSLLGLV